MHNLLIFAAGMVAGTGLGLLIAALIRAGGTDEPAAATAGLTPDEIALARMIGRDIAELPITVYHRDDAPRLHQIDRRHLGSDTDD